MTQFETIMIAVGTLIGAVLVALAVHYLIFAILERIARQPGRHVIDSSLVRHGRTPAKFILPLLAILLAAPFVALPEIAKNPLEHIVGLALLASIAWVLIVVIDVVSDLISARYRVDVKDNLVARGVETQVHILRRILIVIIVIVTGAIMLLTIPSIRAVGASVLASAGLAGLVVGMAAKPTLSNLIAGVQIALTQPFRLEDAVFIYNEWGWIEEITTTYVVVRVWDLRRVVIPLSYVIENPFQNWTKTTANLLGYVYLYTDYTVPVDELRAEFTRLLKSSDKWLGQVNVVQVSNADAHSMELRFLMDCPDSGSAWDLRCYTREGLIKYIRDRYPQSFPKTRAEIGGVLSPPPQTSTPQQPPDAENSVLSKAGAEAQQK